MFTYKPNYVTRKLKQGLETDPIRAAIRNLRINIVICTYAYEHDYEGEFIPIVDDFDFDDMGEELIALQRYFPEYAKDAGLMDDVFTHWTKPTGLGLPKDKRIKQLCKLYRGDE